MPPFITLQCTVTGMVFRTAAMHLEGREPGSVSLVSCITREVLVHFKTTEAMNSFLNCGGNTQYQYGASKTPTCKKFYTWGVYLVDCRNGKFIAKAFISATYKGLPLDIFEGPVAFSYDAAAKAFWNAWNKGDHPFKNYDGSPARLVRIAKEPYLYGEPPTPGGFAK
jgi:hypothetical protein